MCLLLPWRVSSLSEMLKIIIKGTAKLLLFICYNPNISYESRKSRPTFPRYVRVLFPNYIRKGIIVNDFTVAIGSDNVLVGPFGLLFSESAKFHIKSRSQKGLVVSLLVCFKL